MKAKLVCESLEDFYGQGYVSTPTFGNRDIEDTEDENSEEDVEVSKPESPVKIRKNKVYTPRPGSMPDKIMKVLSANKGKEFSSSEISKLFPGKHMSIITGLDFLVDKGLLDISHKRNEKTGRMANMYKINTEETIEEPKEEIPQEEKKARKGKTDTNAWKILDFIRKAGDEGVSFTEIQYFIWTKLKGFDPDNFYKKSTDYSGKKSRGSRGYYATNLYGASNYEGLLPTYCRKNEKGKWVIKRMPGEGENVYVKKWWPFSVPWGRGGY